MFIVYESLKNKLSLVFNIKQNYMKFSNKWYTLINHTLHNIGDRKFS